MAVDYTEYIRGHAEYADQINSSRLFAERGGLDPDVFYPIVPVAHDSDGYFPVADIVELEKKTVKVCMAPGEEPVERELYVEEDDWAFEIIATDGQPENES